MKLCAAIMLLAHSWYPHECCHDQDCKPVPCSELTITKDEVQHNGRSMDISKLRISPDGQCHVCEANYSNHLFCVWMPENIS